MRHDKGGVEVHGGPGSGTLLCMARPNAGQTDSVWLVLMGSRAKRCLARTACSVMGMTSYHICITHSFRHAGRCCAVAAAPTTAEAGLKACTAAPQLQSGARSHLKLGLKASVWPSQAWKLPSSSWRYSHLHSWAALCGLSPVQVATSAACLAGTRAGSHAQVVVLRAEGEGKRKAFQPVSMHGNRHA